MQFEDTADGAWRDRILQTLRNVNATVARRHVKEFAVVRTNDRKGYRDHRDFVNDSPYQGDPMTLIRIEIEVPDDVTPSFRQLVDDVIEAEKLGKKAATRAKLAAAKDKAAAAQAEVDRLEKEMS
jgi:hypothetical protein